MALSHSDLCKIVAERAITSPNAAWFALMEYQSWATQEFPDVLAYRPEGTTLYEIKISHADFLADQKKPVREMRGAYRMYSGIFEKYVSVEKEIRKHGRREWVPGTPYAIALGRAAFNSYLAQEKGFQQAPHLGRWRYYVCEPGVISQEEIPTGWGLLYAKTNPRSHVMHLTEIKPSESFRVNMKDEASIFAHALRRLGNGEDDKIRVRKWGDK